MERRVLLETLASQLPPETIKFSSKLKTIQSNANGDTQLELEDRSKLLAKVLFLSSKMTRNYMIWLICLMYVFWQIVIGCDGIRSKVATWMGFGEPKYVGHCAFRGLGYYPEGQPSQKKVNYIYGRGLRAGYVHVSSIKVYWFICFNSPSLGIQYWYFSFCIITILFYYVCQSLLYYVCAWIRPTSNNWLSIYASHCWTISSAFLRKSKKKIAFQ